MTALLGVRLVFSIYLLHVNIFLETGVERCSAFFGGVGGEEVRGELHAGSERRSHFCLLLMGRLPLPPHLPHWFLSH